MRNKAMSLLRALCLTALGVLLPHARAFAQCANVQVIYQVASGAATKCGVTSPWVPTTPPTYFLQAQQVFTGSATLNVTDSGDFQYDMFSYQYESTEVYNLTCGETTTYAGSASWSEAKSSGGSPSSFAYNSTVDPSSGVWSPCGCPVDSGDNTLSSVVWATIPSYTEYNGSNTITTTGQVGPTIDTTTISGSGTYSGGGVVNVFNGTFTETTNLSHVYTDDLLRSAVIAQIMFGTNWLTNSGSCGSAFYKISSDHISASGAAMEYYFHVTDCQPHTSYLVTWDEVTTYSGGGQAPSVAHLKEAIESNGDPVNGTDGAIHIVPVPASNSTVSEENIQVSYGSSDLAGS